MTFAAGTDVPVERTRAALDTLLRKHGAAQRFTAEDDVEGYAVVGFAIAGRNVRLRVPLPKIAAYATYEHPQRGKLARTPAEQLKHYEQACRSRWRGVLLIVKAKLEFIEYGLSTVEREFLADIFLPTGETVGEWLRPQLAEAYANGAMPALLLGPARRED